MTSDNNSSMMETGGMDGSGTTAVYLKGKHDEKLSPIFMSLSCGYVCMHTPGKKLP